MIRPLVYLCGPMAGCTVTSARNRRDDIAERLFACGINSASPLRGSGGQVNKERVYAATTDNDRAHVTRDCTDIDRAHAVLVDFREADRVSIGSVAEIGYAFAKSKLIVTVMPRDCIHDHMFVRAMSIALFPTLDEAVAYLDTFFNL